MVVSLRYFSNILANIVRLDPPLGVLSILDVLVLNLSNQNYYVKTSYSASFGRASPRSKEKIAAD